MSGHSKWAQIKRSKGAADVRRGQAFTKLAKAIIIEVRQSGIGNPEQNFKLRLFIEKARQMNMPKDTIERAIEKGLGKGEKEESLQEAVYEGFGPGNVAVMVETVTDNKQRTFSEIRQLFERNGGTMGNQGTVAYQFEQKGLITVRKNGKNVDDIFLLAADAGAQDVEEAGEEVLIYTNPEELAKVRDALSAELTIIDAELTRKPTLSIPVTDKNTAEQVLAFMDKMESHDDVQKVYSNFDIPDTVLTA